MGACQVSTSDRTYLWQLMCDEFVRVCPCPGLVGCMRFGASEPPIAPQPEQHTSCSGSGNFGKRGPLGGRHHVARSSCVAATRCHLGALRRRRPWRKGVWLSRPRTWWWPRGASACHFWVITGTVLLRFDLMRAAPQSFAHIAPPLVAPLTLRRMHRMAHPLTFRPAPRRRLTMEALTSPHSSRHCSG